MPKLVPAELKELFDIVSDIKPVRLEFCLLAAERTLRSMITNAVYEQTVPTAQIEALKFAEANLAVYHVLLNTGLRIRRSGLIKKEQDAGGSVTNNVVNEFLDPSEIAALRRQFYAEATDAAAFYRPSAIVRAKATSALIGGGWTGGGSSDF